MSFKRISLVIMVSLLAIFIYSCGKEKVENSAPLVKLFDASTIENFNQLTAANRSEQINLYNKLTAEQKQNVWLLKLSEYDISEFSDDQLSSFNGLVDLVPKLDFGKAEESYRDMVESITLWGDLAQSRFSKEELIDLVFGLNLTSTDTENSREALCNCNTSADCNIGFTCFVTTTTPFCLGTPQGCGFLWLNPCIGECIEEDFGFINIGDLTIFLSDF